jgi:hypothetical protein
MHLLRRYLPLFALMLAAFSLANAQTPLRLRTVTPCRLVDTRNQNGGKGFMGTMSFNLPQLAQAGGANGGCTSASAPSTAQAYSLNVTLVTVNNGPVGYLTIWPTGETQPVVSLLNSDGRIKANAAIVPAGTDGEVSVFVTNTTNVLIDIDAYFDSSADTEALAFFPLTPCRIIDTRTGNGGILAAGQIRSYTIPPTCGVPSDAQAYSFNVTVLPSAGGLDYLTVWPKGESQPVVSTLNAGTSDPAVANAAIVPAGGSNATSFYPHSNSTNLLLDVDGYFAPASSASNPLSLFNVTPCRLLDTRTGIGLFNGTIPVGIVGGPCGVPANTSEAFVLNATVVPGKPPAGFLTLWPEGQAQPSVSTLNAYDGAVTSNMAIVPAGSGNDSINAFADNSSGGTTNLILDISSYFAPISKVNVLTTAVPDAVLNMTYSYQLLATGGVAPYTWKITSGSLPPGVNPLSSGGLISGKPTSTGKYSFTVQATDSNTPAGTATADLSLTVDSSAGTLTITSPAQFNASVNTPFNAVQTANGGLPPYSWTATGALPPGLSLNSSTGLISGIPGTPGLTQFSVTATDSQGTFTSQQVSIVVNTGDTNGTLNGQYAGSFAGFENGKYFVAAFGFTANGNGKITAGEIDTNNSAAGAKHATITSGTYTISSNGLGQISWTDSSGGSVSLLVSTGSAEIMRVIGFNQNGSSGTWGSGVLRQQNPADFTEAALAGKWTFGYQGFDSSGDPLSAAGIYTLSGGTLSNGLVDINDFGTFTPEVPFSGKITSNPPVDSNGRSTVQLTIDGVHIDEAVYVISGGETVLTDIDTGGSLFIDNSLKQTSGSFGLGSMNGNSVGRGSRIHNVTTNAENQALVGLFTADGKGNISLAVDTNTGGSFGFADELATYAVASNSRTVFSLGGGAEIVCYLIGVNEGFCINAIPASGDNDKGAEVIYFEPQKAPAGGFTAASFSGQYLGGSLPQYLGTETGIYTQVDSNVADGLSNFQSTYSRSGPGGSNLNLTLSGTYEITGSSGAIGISESGNPLYQGFMISPNKVAYVTSGSGSIPLSIIEVTSSAPRHP